MNELILNRLKENSTYIGLLVIALIAKKYVGVSDLKDAISFVDIILALTGVSSVLLPDDFARK